MPHYWKSHVAAHITLTMTESGFSSNQDSVCQMKKKQSWRALVIILGELGSKLIVWGKTELGSTGNYFRGAGEQAHSLGDFRSPAKK